MIGVKYLKVIFVFGRGFGVEDIDIWEDRSLVMGF